MTKPRRLGSLAAGFALAAVVALIALGVLVRRPVGVRGSVTGADVEMVISEKGRQFVVGLTGIKALRLPVYEVDVGGLQEAAVEYQELGASGWSQIPGTVRWLNVVPRPEGSDSEPGVFIRSNGAAAGAQTLNLRPNRGNVETLKFSRRDSTEFLALAGDELSLAGWLDLVSMQPGDQIHLEVQPTTGYLTLQYITATRNEPRNLSQITKMRLVPNRDEFRVDLRPSTYARWDFGFIRDLQAKAASWSVGFDNGKPLRIVTLLCTAKAGRMQLGNGDPEDVINPTVLALGGSALDVADKVMVDPAGVTLVLNGAAATITKNDQDYRFKLLFRDVTAVITVVAAGLAAFFSLVAGWMKFRTDVLASPKPVAPNGANDPVTPQMKPPDGSTGRRNGKKRGKH